MTTGVVLTIGLIGLALVGLVLLRDQDRRIRITTTVGIVGGFSVATGLALVAGKGALSSVAIGSLSAAVLAAALMAQWRLIRALFARQGHEL